MHFEMMYYNVYLENVCLGGLFKWVRLNIVQVMYVCDVCLIDVCLWCMYV